MHGVVFQTCAAALPHATNWGQSADNVRYAHLEQETLAKAAEVAAETLKRAVDQR